MKEFHFEPTIGDSSNTGGAVTFWRPASHTNYDQLKLAMDAAGFGKACPSRRTDLACLKEAIQAAEGGKATLIPLDDKSGFAVILEALAGTVQVGSNWGKVDKVIRLTGESPKTIVCDPADQLGDLPKHFFESYGMATASQLGKMLVDICKELNGTCLRENGGIYWLPQHSMRYWQSVAEAIEQVKGGVVYVIRHQMDADATKAVLDAIVHETEMKILGIQSELGTGELGYHALEHRGEQAMAVREKLKAYEGFLGTSLAAVVKQVEDVETAATMAALEAGAALRLEQAAKV